MFAPSKEYLCTSYTYRLQNGNSWTVCSQLFYEKSQPKSGKDKFKNVTCHMSHVTLVPCNTRKHVIYIRLY